MSVAREHIVQIARSWLGTPFVHQGRVKGKGCDCLGLVLGVGAEAGVKLQDREITAFDSTGYSMNPDGAFLKGRLDVLLHSKSKAGIEAGDIFLMNFGSNPQHLGIFSDHTHSPALAIIHCYSQAGKVVEHRLNNYWFSKIEAVYSLEA